MSKDFDFNSLNESNGSIFFNDELFKNKIENIVEQIKHPIDNVITIKLFDNLDNEYGIEFYKLSIQLNLSWIKILDVYYTFDDTFKYITGADAKAPSVKTDDSLFNSTVNIGKNNLLNGPVFMYVDTSLKVIDFKNYYCGILYHEIGHLFDLLFKKNNTNNEFEYIFNEQLKNIDILKRDIRLFKNRDISMFIKWLMYFCNEAEQHGFNEQTYFQIISACSNIKYKVRELKTKLKRTHRDEILAYNKEYILKNISDEIGNIYDLKSGCEFLLANIDKFKIEDLGEINNYLNKKFSKKSLLIFLNKKITHLWNNIVKNYNYFYDVFKVENKILYESINQNIFYKWSIYSKCERGYWEFDKDKKLFYKVN